MGSPRPGKWGPPRGRGGVGVWCRGRGPGARAGEGGLAVEGEWLTQRGGWHAALPLQASVADHRTRVTEGSGAGWGRVGARGPTGRLSDSRLGARPARKGLGEGAPLVSTCDGELNFSFTRCRGNAGGGDEWAGRGALRVNQLRRRPRGVPALARRCLGNAQRTGAQLPRLRKGAAPEWMNCPTLSRVYSGLPPHSPAYLDLTPHPLGPREPLIAGGTHWTAFAEQPGRELCQWQKASPQPQPLLPFP